MLAHQSGGSFKVIEVEAGTIARGRAGRMAIAMVRSDNSMAAWPDAHAAETVSNRSGDRSRLARVGVDEMPVTDTVSRTAWKRK
jgi:hypothetical protein